VARSTACYDTTNIFILPAIYNVSPKTGSVGTTVNVFGNGYAYEDWVYIQFGKTEIALPVKNVSARGSFSTSFAVDIQPLGTVTITGRSNIFGSATNQFRICGEITMVTPIAGSVGTVVSIIGNGYGAGEDVRVDFGVSATRVIGTVDTNGVFSTTFTIDTQAAGTRTIVVTGMTTNDTDDRPFKIFANITQITPTEGYATIVINVKGNGYGVSESVKIDFGKTMSLAFCQSDEYGSFDITFTTDTQAMGSNTVAATGLSSNEYAWTYFAIVPQIVIVTPTKGTVGTMISIEGRGYQSNEGVRIDFGYTLGITQTTALANGVFNATFAIDTQKCGSTTIIAYGSISKVKPTKHVTIVSSVVQVTPSRGSVGTVVNVLGTGYGKSEPIRVDFGTTTTIAIVTSSIYGKVEASFTINTQSCGTTTVTVSGLESNELSNSRFVIFSNIISMTPTKATVGTPINLFGNGYGASEPIDVNLGKRLPIRTVTTDDTGLFSLVFTVDTQKCGTTTVEAIGRTSKESASNGVNIYANIWSSIWQVSPNAGTVGTMVTVSGNGFDELERIRVKFGLTPMSEKVTSEDGSFTVTFTVDTQSAGNIVIVAEGDSGQRAESIFVIIGNLFVTPTSGTVGRVVQVHGEGFTYNEKVRVDFGKTPSVSVVYTDIDGIFNATFTINTQPCGTTTILAKDDPGVSAETTLYIHGKVTLVTPNRGTVGTRVNVSGNGYGAGEQIRLEFGSTMSIGNTLASNMGTFTAAFTIDTQGSGQTTITAH